MKQIKLFAKGIENLTAFVKESRCSAVGSSTPIEGLEYAKNLSTDIVQLKGKNKNFTEIVDEQVFRRIQKSSR